MVTKNLTLADKACIDLRAYYGDDEWFFISSSFGYDAETTAEIDPKGFGDTACFADGSIIRYDFKAKKWIPDNEKAKVCHLARR